MKEELKENKLWDPSSFIKGFKLEVDDKEIGLLQDNFRVDEEPSFFPYWRFECGYAYEKDDKCKLAFIMMHPIFRLDGPKKINIIGYSSNDVSWEIS